MVSPPYEFWGYLVKGEDEDSEDRPSYDIDEKLEVSEIKNEVVVERFGDVNSEDWGLGLHLMQCDCLKRIRGIQKRSGFGRCHA